ncbi:MAG: PEGA domain-containing protein [Hyphomicrobiales bacterium]
MKSKTMFLLLLALGAWCAPFAAGPHAQLIEPTRSLPVASEAMGLLNVLSEPPGLEVQVDGRIIGKTPVFSARFPAGIHALRIKDSEADIRLTTGKTTAISWFKGAFIEIPEAAKPSREIPGEPRAAPSKPRTEEGSGAQPGAANDAFYWPLNPRGPIY